MFNCIDCIWVRGPIVHFTQEIFMDCPAILGYLADFPYRTYSFCIIVELEKSAKISQASQRWSPP